LARAVRAVQLPQMAHPATVLFLARLHPLAVEVAVVVLPVRHQRPSLMA